jgi:hypothetical protein
MNAIQQISLKLQMGLDPCADIQPTMLRSMWSQLSRERAEGLEASQSESIITPSRTTHPSLFQTG